MSNSSHFFEHECPSCPWLFSSAIELQNHVIDRHVLLICLTCDKKAFHGEEAFRSHYPFRLHEFECGKCGAALNGREPRNFSKALGHLKGCQSIVDRHCRKFYGDREAYYEHCRTDETHIKLADSWEEEDNRRRRREWEEREAEKKRRELEIEASWRAYRIQRAEERAEDEHLRNQPYPPFETEQPAEEACAQKNDPPTIEDQKSDAKYVECHGNEIELFGSENSSESYEYPTDWTDFATFSEEEKMSIKERMVRKNRRAKRALKAEAKKAEAERLKKEKEMAAEAARAEARAKLTPEERWELDEKERINKELIRAWVRERAQARIEYSRLIHRSYHTDE
ncbi:hypothetical protein TWF718_004596 [Orbilia javanica]|uniref:C2H2-type domain-containing protein n=1 Tax=Orbilia javanica TaxID=47235 RepID=A0AAN8N6G8_9PEZI